MSKSAAILLASHVESRCRKIVQEARKVARHAKRKRVRAKDVNDALRAQNLEPVLGFSSARKMPFIRLGDEKFTSDSKDKFKSRLKELQKQLSNKNEDGADRFTGGRIDAAIDKLDVRTEAIRFCVSKIKNGYPLNTLRQKLIEADVKGIPELVPRRAFVLDDKNVDLARMKSDFVPLLPVSPSLRVHWLAVHGVQPCIPENNNPSFEDVASIPGSLVVPRTSSSNVQTSERAGDVHVNLLLKHDLSEELAQYFQGIKKALLFEDGVTVDNRSQALKSLAQDAGLQQLVPYLSKYMVEQITSLLKSKPRPRHLLRTLESNILAVSSMLRNPHLNIEFYLQQIMPMMLSCLLHKTICADNSEPHWRVRELAAQVVAEVCEKYGDAYPTLQSRVTETYYQAISKPSTPLTTHYGVIVGIERLGPRVVESLLMPLYAEYVKKLGAQMKNSTKASRKMEAERCWVVLNRAAGLFVRHKIDTRSRFHGSGLKSHLPLLKDGTSPFSDESMQPYLLSEEDEFFASIATRAIL